MIITRTPYRISFFGGGTDYPSWYDEHGGCVLSTTIDKYCYITCRYLPPFFEHRYRIVYSIIENVQKPSEIRHPAVRAALTWLGNSKGVEIHHDGDLPARSGLGTSSSFSVGLIHALNGLEGRMISQDQLARDAIHLEQSVIKEVVGSQDQVAAAFGGLNKIDFSKDSGFSVSKVIVPADRILALQSNLMLFFTGFSRMASEIAEMKVSSIPQKTSEFKMLGELVTPAIGILNNPTADLMDFGRLLHESWLIKRSITKSISNQFIDDAYEAALKAGAIGGKILGAGGGGFLLLFAEPKLHGRISAALDGLIHVPFKFESSGSRVALYQPNGL